MSVKKGVSNSKLVAKLVTEEKGPCAFCQRDVDDELIYGKLYAIGSIKCHYFCALLSCCLVQKGRDEVGLFGFLYPDILAEIERSKKHKCSYCNKEGASLGCSVSQCRKQFHLPCGREKNAVSLFYGSYKSFCQNHTPKQKIAEDVMAKVKARQQADRKKIKLMKAGQIVEDNEDSPPECVCVICYEAVTGAPSVHTFWPPCCARDAWFHRTCLQRMALSAGMHYLKCPLCNDKEHFYEAVVSQGYYVPDRDAAWELEQNAFADMYSRPVRCLVEHCECPMGRGHDCDTGMWDIKLCLLCGSSGAHAHCLSLLGEGRLVCDLCKAANTDIEGLANTVEAVMVTEQAQASLAERRPVMPSRMSLRRTKQRIMNSASSSSTTIKSESDTSREDLNLKPPKRPQSDRTPKDIIDMQHKYSPSKGTTLRDIQNKLLSPSKVIEQLYEKISVYNVDSKLLDEVRDVCRKPKPLSVKKKIVDDLLDNIVNNIVKENAKSKEPVIEWYSPKKCLENSAVPSEESPKKKWSNEGVNSPCKSPPHTPKKTTESEKQSPSKPSPKIENQDVINKTPLKSDDSYNIRNNDDNNEEKPEKITSDDESSSSTFQLPPEFVADDSNDSLPTFETPKLKTVDIQKDSSLEISENDEVVKVDVVKMEDLCQDNDFIKNLNLKSPAKSKKCVLKFSPIDKESLTDNVGFDVECFKNTYLNEVGRDFKCKFKHNHIEVPKERSKIKTPIDFAIEATKGRKRSIDNCEDIPKKKRKVRTEKRQKKINSEARRLKKKNKKKKDTSTNIELVNGQENLKLSLQGKRKRKKTKVSIKDKEIKVRIQWKKKRFQVKITESEVQKECPKLKQYVLNYTDVKETMLEKPKFDVTPIKRKYVKQEKSPDNLKQTSIQNFFKIVLPKQEKQ